MGCSSLLVVVNLIFVSLSLSLTDKKSICWPFSCVCQH
jgi:hypothetical protein